MYLSRFGVKNYKCLGDIDIPLTPIHVLIGENDAGKTSLLEAMAALCASSDQDVRKLFPEPWDAGELVFHRSPDSRVNLVGQWNSASDAPSTSSVLDCEYDLTIEFPPSGKECKICREHLQVGGSSHDLSSETPVLTSLFRWKRGWKLPEGIKETRMQLLSEILKPSHKYAFDAKLMALPAAFSEERKFRLDSDGFGLATLLDDILSYDAELFIRLRDEFCRFFPQFRTLRIQTEKALSKQFVDMGLHRASVAPGKGIYFETKAGETVRAQQSSDGAVLFLGFLALAHLPEPPGVLLIEEPENGIYPKRLGQVIKMLKELVRRDGDAQLPQVIITTHSPYVLSFFDPEEVTLLGRSPDDPDGPVRARPLRDAPNIHERLGGGDFYLGELWYNLSEEELFGEP